MRKIFFIIFMLTLSLSLKLYNAERVQISWNKTISKIHNILKHNDMIFICCTDKIVRINPVTGKTLWENNSCKGKIIDIRFAQDVLVFRSNDMGTIGAITYSGETLWSKKIGNSSYHYSFSIHEENVIYSDRNNKIASRDIRTGKMIWEIKTESMPGPIITNANHLFCCLIKGKLLQIDPQVGVIQNSVTTDQRILSNPLLFNNNLLLISEENKILSFQLNPLTQLWTTESLGILFTKNQNYTPIQLKHELIHRGVYYLSGSRHLIALNLTDGKVLWKKNVKINYDYVTWKLKQDNPILVTEYHVILPTHEGLLISMNRNTGKIEWTYDLYKMRSILYARFDDFLQNPNYDSRMNSINRYLDCKVLGKQLTCITSKGQILVLDTATGKLLKEYNHANSLIEVFKFSEEIMLVSDDENIYAIRI